MPHRFHQAFAFPAAAFRQCLLQLGGKVQAGVLEVLLRQPGPGGIR